MDEHKPDEPAGWEPIGLQAAAEAVHGEGAAAPSAPGVTVNAEPRLAGAESWERLASVLLELAFSRLEQRDPLWKLSDGERDNLAGAWGDYLAELVGKAPGALGTALLATGVVVGPRVIEDARKRRAARTLDVDAEVRPQGAP